MNSGLLMIPVGAAVVVGVLYAAGAGLSLPVVSYDLATGECVSVLSESGEYSCDYLPARYIHQWVSVPAVPVVAEPEEALRAARERSATLVLIGGQP